MAQKKNAQTEFFRGVTKTTDLFLQLKKALGSDNLAPALLGRDSQNLIKSLYDSELLSYQGPAIGKQALQLALKDLYPRLEIDDFKLDDLDLILYEDQYNADKFSLKVKTFVSQLNLTHTDQNLKVLTRAELMLNQDREKVSVLNPQIIFWDEHDKDASVSKLSDELDDAIEVLEKGSGDDKLVKAAEEQALQVINWFSSDLVHEYGYYRSHSAQIFTPSRLKKSKEAIENAVQYVKSRNQNHLWDLSDVVTPDNDNIGIDMAQLNDDVKDIDDKIKQHLDSASQFRDSFVLYKNRLEDALNRSVQFDYYIDVKVTEWDHRCSTMRADDIKRALDKVKNNLTKTIKSYQ